MNQSPARTVRLVLNALTAEPDWDLIYPFIQQNHGWKQSVPLDEFKAQIPPVVGGMVA